MKMTKQSNDKIIIKRRRRSVLVGRKLKSIGNVYFEIHHWNGFGWDMLEEEPATLAEAKKIARAS
jgi:hypothetical protein